MLGKTNIRRPELLLTKKIGATAKLSLTSRKKSEIITLIFLEQQKLFKFLKKNFASLPTFLDFFLEVSEKLR